MHIEKNFPCFIMQKKNKKSFISIISRRVIGLSTLSSNHQATKECFLLIIFSLFSLFFFFFSFPTSTIFVVAFIDTVSRCRNLINQSSSTSRLLANTLLRQWATGLWVIGRSIMANYTSLER